MDEKLKNRLENLKMIVDSCKSPNDACFNSIIPAIKGIESYLNNTKVNDNVNHPSHYTWLKDKCGIEVLDITRHLDFNTGNAIKYLLRAGRKDKSKTVEDLQKAIFYINDKIKMIQDEVQE